MIISFGPLHGGTEFTRRFCEAENKPCLVVDGRVHSPASAGSGEKQGQAYAREVLTAFIDILDILGRQGQAPGEP